jgi:hypothetical protein
MYDLPIDFDESSLVGRYLECVNIGAFTTSLLLSRPQIAPGESDTITISIHGTVSFGIREIQHEGNAESPISLSGLVSLLTKVVQDVKRVGRASLQILLEGEAQITLVGEDSPDFESYVINIPGTGIFVV